MASLIDLHTSHSSGCNQMTAGELIETAIEARCDTVAITEHHITKGRRSGDDE